ncbi:MAG TPA: hypothetical protein VF441_00830 [Acidimicrobiia bacterium]
MPEHVHVELPEELHEGSHPPVSHRERLFELVAVLLLSVATVCIAWSGYQAAKWSGLQARRYAQASTARSQANRVSTLGGQERLQDLTNFNRWLELTTESTPGDLELADLYNRRFRPEFRPAFTAWLAQDPLHSLKAIPSPLLMPQYKIANLVKADHLESLGNERFNQAKEATEHADDYIFGTVFFAAVLFFGAMSMRFDWVPMRATVLILALVFLGYGVAKLLSLPTL